MTAISSLLLNLCAFGALVWLAHRDYRGWLALGEGGLPANLLGWLTVTRLRLMKADPIDIAALVEEIGSTSDRQYLDQLPPRNGPRPRIAPWPIPHRQCNQFISSGIRRKLDALFDDAVARNAPFVHYKQSYFEQHSPAVTLCDPGYGHADAKFGRGELAHIHLRDGSMHMIFSASDAANVVESGWGEFHPLAGRIPLLPKSYVYVYPPRDDIELEVVGQLLDASIAHMTKGGTMKLPQADEYRGG
jgi:hypothetical protein